MSALRPITIVGGGLAGLSLGIALRKAGVPTEVFEAGDYPRHRVCGEFITGLDDDTIEQLGIGPAFIGAGNPRSIKWFVKECAVGQLALPAPARALSRFVLDARLAELFVAGGGCLTTKTRYTSTLHTPGIVVASGRRADRSSAWLGLKLHVRNLVATDELEFHLGDSAYVGTSAVEAGWTNVCGLFRRRHGLLFERDDALVAYLRACGLNNLAERLAIATIRPGSRCAVAGFAFDRDVEEGIGIRLGDTCAMTPPFTGNGMAMAFTSASLAVTPLVAWARDEQSWDFSKRTIHERLRNEFRLRLASASFLHPFLLNRALQTIFSGVTQAGLLPLTTLYRLTH